MKITHILFLVLINCLTACMPASINKIATTTQNPDFKFPPTGLMVNYGYVPESTSYTPQGVAIRFVDESGLMIRAELVKSNIFQTVELNNILLSPFLDVQYTCKGAKPYLWNAAKLLFGAATLILVPTTQYLDCKMTVALKYNGTTVKQYEYAATERHVLWMFNDPKNGQRNSIKYLVSLFVTDLRNSGIKFAPQPMPQVKS